MQKIFFKRFMSRVLFSSLSVAQIFMPIAHAQEKLAINKDGIKVWTFPTANNSAMSYRASRVLTASVSSATAMIMDTKSLPAWVPYTKRVDLVEQDTKNGTFSLYMVIAFPFPLSSRDVVVKGGWKQNPDLSVKVWSNAIEDSRYPKTDKYVRIKEYDGSWLIRPIGNGQVEITTTGYANPAGGIPLSIANQFVETQPYKMLKNMNGQIGKYQNAVVPLVINP